MTLQELDDFLRTKTESEQWHLEHPGKKSVRYHGMPWVEMNYQRVYCFDFSEDISRDGITIFKESRYTELYAHYHKYVEINYVYSGTCHYTIKGKKMTLNRGDVCILEEQAVHSAEYKGEDDIVINIVLRDDYYGMDFLKQMDRGGILPQFLLDCCNKSIEHEHFLVFRNQGNEMFDLVIKGMMCLYFSERLPGFYAMLHEYIRLVYLHLSVMTWDVGNSEYIQNEDEICVKIIQQIHNTYQTCTLKEIAEQYNYNYTYLGNLLKQKTGHTFSELKLEQQMLSAQEQLCYTGLSIGEIAERCGFGNHSWFYRKFREYFGCYPSEFRRQNRI